MVLLVSAFVSLVCLLWPVVVKIILEVIPSLEFLLFRERFGDGAVGLREVVGCDEGVHQLRLLVS